MDYLIELIRAQCSELVPRPTSLAPKVEPLPGLRAVLFDIYGTLMISASGDIGSDSGDHKAAAFAELAELYGLELQHPAADAMETLERMIRSEHARLRDDGIDYPEIEIRSIWNIVFERVVKVAESSASIDLDRFSVDFETRVNPTWPMPGLAETLDGLHSAGLVMGIVSNAQFFTPLLFRRLLDAR